MHTAKNLKKSKIASLYHKVLLLLMTKIAKGLVTWLPNISSLISETRKLMHERNCFQRCAFLCFYNHKCQFT